MVTATGWKIIMWSRLLRLENNHMVKDISTRLELWLMLESFHLTW